MYSHIRLHLVAIKLGCCNIEIKKSQCGIKSSFTTNIPLSETKRKVQWQTNTAPSGTLSPE
jgi:hypothetical protein